MKIALGSSLAVLALTLAVLGTSASLGQDQGKTEGVAPTGTVSLVILHTNDVHGQALPLGKGEKQRGGYAALAATIERERAKAKAAGAEPVLVDAGDIWVGPPEGTRTEGIFSVGIMNEMGYDLGAIGNHEFDHGPDCVARLAAAAHFPLLAANLKEVATHERPKFAKASVTRTISGVKVRFIGLITSGLHEVTIPSATSMLEVENEADAVERELAHPGDDAPDLTVLVTHSGHGVDRRLAEKFHGRIAAIVGGHSHFTIENAWHVPEKADDAVLIGQTGSRGAALGRMELVYDRAKKRVVKSEGHLIPVLPSEGEHPKVKELVNVEVAAVEKLLGVKIGEATVALDRSSDHGNGTCSLGNFWTNVMRATTQADVAFTNRTGLRADMPSGELKLRHLYEVDPFGNTMVTFTFTGAELKSFLEDGCSRHLLECSGLVLKFDHSKPKGSRLVSVDIGGKPLDESKDYKIATNSFLAEGGDGWTQFKNAQKNRNDSGVAIRDMVRKWFEANSAALVAPADADRVIDVAAKK